MKQTEKMQVRIQNLYKSFERQQVFSDFSYSFAFQGFYLLFGESGCGKTTLLNILSGMTDFNSGSVFIAGELFENAVDWDKISGITGYITQDTVLIDYLTVGEQLELTGADKGSVLSTLASFDMEKHYDRYPASLSGGERQRVAIVQALLQQKKILLLDEPTASLDKENKTSVFKALKSVSKNMLVICSSHDAAAKEYADNVIDFAVTEQVINDTDYTPPENKEFYQINKKVRLFPYYKKWYTWKKREHHSLIYLLIIYALVFFALLLGDNPSHKTQKSIDRIYKINHCAATAYDNGKALFDILSRNNHIYNSVMIYNGSAPDNMKNGKGHDTTIFGVLPGDADFFGLSGKIAYGKYFSGRNQVILSYGRAIEYGDPAMLIGQTLTLDLYDGTRQLEIVGIFDEFLETEIQYLRQSCINEPNSCIYLSGDYTAEFQDDNEFNWLGQRTYILYFKSYSSMRSFYNENRENTAFRLEADKIDYSIIQKFEILFYILYPFGFLIILFSIIFYYQTKRIELFYNKHLISVYDYLGFSKKEIRSCWLKGAMTENAILLATAFTISIVISFVVNAVNEHFLLVPFCIFTFNPVLIGMFVVFNILFSIFMSLLTFNKIKKISWKELFFEQRDLW